MPYPMPNALCPMSYASRHHAMALQVQLGQSITFLATPLRNWWGRPALLTAWLVFGAYLVAVMVG